MTVAWLDKELTTSTTKSTMMTMAIIRLPSPGQARMSPLWQSSFVSCPNPRLWRDGKPTKSCVPFLSAPWCSRLKVPRLDDVGLSPTSPHHRLCVKRKPRST
jgi:hypothetical protein